MSSNPLGHSSLSNSSRSVSATGLWTGNSSYQGSPPTNKGRRKAKSSHTQVWLNISKTAALHTCHKAFSREQPSSMQCSASGDQASTSGREEDSLLIVGPGVLGGLVGHLYKQQCPGAEVVGQTNTDANHDRLRKLGISARLKQDAGASKFQNVLFSAPPSGSSDYVAEVEKAIQLWDESNTFIFISSSGSLDTSKAVTITESTSTQKLGTSERVDRLLKAEEAVLNAGGCVLRLVGLYHLNRGAHTFFLRKGEVERAGNHVVNLIHYEDAASLVLKILEGSDQNGAFKQRTFLGTDSTPITFQEMMDYTLKSGKFSGECKFTAPDEETAAPGSSNEQTREELKWTPKYKSFKDFMLNGATDFYSQA